jgi:hypothetical protein
VRPNPRSTPTRYGRRCKPGLRYFVLCSQPRLTAPTSAGGVTSNVRPHTKAVLVLAAMPGAWVALAAKPMQQIRSLRDVRLPERAGVSSSIVMGSGCAVFASASIVAIAFGLAALCARHLTHTSVSA